MKTILLISKDNGLKPIFTEGVKQFKEEVFEIITASTTEAAENVLFEKNVALIVMDWELPEAAGFTEDLKNDEMFRLVPVLALLKEDSREDVSHAMQSGADNYLKKKDVAVRAYLVIRPLIKNNVLNSELVEKISLLQEQAIHDFILLDLIKKYIPKTIWDLANNFAYEQKIRIPEEELELTIVFADIKGFTNMAHNLKPIEVIKTLNLVFEVVTRIVYAHNGDIDKFIGDAFLGLFREAKDAVKASVLLQKEIEELNNRRQKEQQEAIYFRIGIHTGPVIRGNVGGNQRYDNTLIGNTVNIAAWLESHSREGDILISEDTRQKAQIDIPTQYKQHIQLKGSDRQQIVYQVYNLLKNNY
jgi:adenylate cyclase